MATVPPSAQVPFDADGSVDLLAREAPKLTRIGVRPRPFAYLARVWRYRSFTSELIQAELRQRTSRDVLGALWYVLSPILQSIVYYIVFVILLNTTNVPNPVFFLSAGVFTFAFTSRSLVSSAKSINASITLVRSLRFPRMVMPLSAVGVETYLLVPTFGVLTLIALGTGIRPSAWWLLVPVVLALQTGMILGIGLLLARFATVANDVVQAMPFMLRLWLYLSGVFYSFSHIDSSKHPLFAKLLFLNPMRAYIELIRDAYNGIPSPLGDWEVAIGWPIVLLLIGFVYFWRAEDSYGR